MPDRSKPARSLFNWLAAHHPALDLRPGPDQVLRPRRALPSRGRVRRSQRVGGERRRVAASARDMTHSEPVKLLSLECRREIRRDDTATLIVDLGEVEKADTKLVACLVGVYRLACARAVQVEMFLPHAVEEVVTLCRLERLIERTRPQRISPASGKPKPSPDPSTSG